MRPHGNAHKLHRRRLLAVVSLEKGTDPREIARRFRVSVRSVYRWAQRWAHSGPDGLQARPVPGRPSKLTPAQRDELVEWLCSLPAEKRTRRRIRKHIQKRYGITYTLPYIGALRRSWGFRPQPAAPSGKKRIGRRKLVWRYFGPPPQLKTSTVADGGTNTHVSAS